MCTSRGQAERCSNFFLSTTSADELQMSGYLRNALQAAWQRRDEGAALVVLRKHSATQGRITATTAHNLGLHQPLVDDSHYEIYAVSRKRQRKGEGRGTQRVSKVEDIQMPGAVRRRRAQRRQLHSTPSTTPNTDSTPHDPCMNIHSFMCKRTRSRL